jgi:hypothetical protein
MLSILACYSCYLAVPAVALSWVVSREDGLLLKKHERSRPRLWVIAVIILVCGIDFAVLPRAMHPFFRPRLYAFDAGVLLIPCSSRLCSNGRLGICGSWAASSGCSACCPFRALASVETTLDSSAS